MRTPVIVTLLACLLTLSPGLSATAAERPAPGRPFMLATAGTGGTYYIIGGAMADIMRKHANTRVTPLTTNGSMENCRLVSAGRAGIGFSAADLAFYAYHGQEMFRQRPLDNLRYVAGGHFSHAQVVVPEDSSIRSVAELKGKKVAVGAQGSAVLSWSMDVLAVAGLTLDDVTPYYLSMSEMTGALKDGTIDAALYGAGVPTSSVTNIFAENPMRLVPIEMDAVQRWLATQGPEKNALIDTYVIPAGTYRGQELDIPTLSYRACLLANAETPEETVYQFLKTVADHQPELAQVHPSGKEYTQRQMNKGATIPLHPGSARFFREAGLL